MAKQIFLWNQTQDIYIFISKILILFSLNESNLGDFKKEEMGAADITEQQALSDTLVRITQHNLVFTCVPHID